MAAIVPRGTNLRIASAEFLRVKGGTFIDTLYNLDVRGAYRVWYRFRAPFSGHLAREKAYWSDSYGSSPGSYASGTGGRIFGQLYQCDETSGEAITSAGVFATRLRIPANKTMVNGVYQTRSQVFSEDSITSSKPLVEGTLYIWVNENQDSNPAVNWSSLDAYGTAIPMGRPIQHLSPMDWACGYIIDGVYQDWTRVGPNGGTSYYCAPVAQYFMADGRSFGFSPMESGNASSRWTETNRPIEQYYPAISARTLSGLFVTASKVSGSGGLAVSLWNYTSGAQIGETLTINDPGNSASTGVFGGNTIAIHQWYDVAFNNPVSLPAGANIGLRMSPQGSAVWRFGSYRNGSYYGFSQPAANSECYARWQDSGSAWRSLDLWNKGADGSARDNNWRVGMYLAETTAPVDPGGPTEPETPVTGLTFNTIVGPASKAIALSSIARTMTKGQINASQCQYAQQQIGSSGVDLDLMVGGIVCHSVRIPGMPTVSGNRVRFALGAETYAFLADVSTTSSITARIKAVNGSIDFRAPVNGGQVALSRNISTGIGFIPGDISILWDPSLDGTTTTGGVISGAFDITVNSDSIGKGSGPSGSTNEAGYVSYRGGIYRALQAAGRSFTVKGASGWANGVRGSTTWTATSAQGGSRLIAGTSPNILSLAQSYATTNPASSYANTILVHSGGVNDLYAGRSQSQIVADYQTAISQNKSILPGIVQVVVGLIPSPDASAGLVNAVANLCQSLDDGRTVFWVDPRFLTGAHFSDSAHLNQTGADLLGARIGETILNRVLASGTTTPTNPGDTTGTGSGTTLAQLIAQNQAHEVMPYVANPSQLYTRRPFKIFERETYGGSGTTFSLMGANCMPSWFNPANKSSLATQWFTDFVPWWVVCCQRNSSGGNANGNTNAAILIDLMQLLIWRGGTSWDAARDGSTSWTGSYNYDFTTFQSGASSRTVSGGGVICRMSANGQQVIHGGGAGIRGISSPSTVRGVVYRVRMQLVDWTTGRPLSDSNARLAAYCGADVVPPGGSANSSFLPLNYAPGLGCGAFIAALPTQRYMTFTTLTNDQLAVARVPGYN